MTYRRRENSTHAFRPGKKRRWWTNTLSVEPNQNVRRLSPMTHPVFCLGCTVETLQCDLALVQQQALFMPFGKTILVHLMAYGEVARLAQSHTKRGEIACLLINQQEQPMVSIAVDLALFLFEYSGEKPVCLYLYQDASGTDRVTVKYPSPR